MLARKEDTRRKIQLGGLVVKAGLSEESAAVVLGLLAAARSQLAGPEAETYRRQWKTLGDQLFASTAEDEAEGN